jgi:hypothetical protein
VTEGTEVTEAPLVSSLKCRYSAGRGMFETRIIDSDPHVTCDIINVGWGWSTFALLNVVVLHKLESRLTSLTSDILQDIQDSPNDCFMQARSHANTTH